MTQKENYSFNSESLVLTDRDKKVIKNFIRDFGPLIILWLLNKEKLYGNAIINRINLFYPDKNKKITGSSRIYPMLHDLEDNGFIEVSLEFRGRQQIKYYEITDKGREELLRVKRIFKDYANREFRNFMTEMLF